MSAERLAVEVAAGELHERARDLLARGLRLALVAGHDDGDALRVVYLFCDGPPDRRHEVTVRLDPRRPEVPSLSDLSFAASRFERELRDNFGIEPLGHPFVRPLVRHQHWPEDWHPMRRGAGPMPAPRPDAEPYPFVEVRGAGVYEIPVGPVHAGLIEPGHFRFSVVGETILKMTARLWYVHRGVELMFQGVDVHQGVEVAQRVAGDSALAHSLAYCMAVEEATGLEVHEDQRHLRAMLLEMERLYNHVADVGAMCNDVSYAVASARAQTLRERLLRLNEATTGHRLLRGALDVAVTRVRSLPSERELKEIGEGFDDLVGLALSNSVVVDRFEGTAVLSRDDAAAIGTLGVVARSAGLECDARWSHPFVAPAPSVVRHEAGDVMARFVQRAEEFRDSLEMVRRLAGSATRLEVAAHGRGAPRSSGVGIVEGWRGTVVHRVEVDPGSRVSRARIVDPSFFNWPALAIALKSTIVPDFPLANKSFNLSYAGNDL
ncbi:MAG: NADH-quinone oxidoreductase subunit C [Acidobacteriota bacterium]|nr:NADH-quinone oxidoreductase subunit C [Acidobacteriota bacterium]